MITNILTSNEFRKFLTNVSDTDYRILRENYDDFLEKDFRLGYFVPCNENDVPLEEPKGEKCCSGIYNDCFCHGGLIYDDEEIQKFIEAKQKVLFEGFELVHETKDTCMFRLNGKFPYIMYKKSKLSFVTKFNQKVKLTQTAKKSIFTINIKLC